MAGVRGRPPSSAPPPQGTRVYVGWQSLSLMLPTPHSTKQKEKPPPPGATPTPTWAVHSVVFSSPMAQGGWGWGRSPSVSESQLDSGRDRVC